MRIRKNIQHSIWRTITGYKLQKKDDVYIQLPVPKPKIERYY